MNDQRRIKRIAWTAVSIVTVMTIGALGLTGCSSHRRTHTAETTTVTSYPDQSTTVTSDPQATTVTEERTVATSSETHDDGDGGLIGGTFRFIGAVVAFPFRVLGGIFDALF